MARKRVEAVEAVEEPKGKRSLDAVFADIKKAFDVTPDDNFDEIPRWACSQPSLAYLTGGGVPIGRSIEIFGPESSGKTTLAYIMAADVQKAGGRCMLLDVECAYAPKFAANFVDIHDRWHVMRPETTEQTYSIIEKLVESGQFDFIIVDSLAAMTTEAESAGEMGESHMGLQARLIGQGNRKLVHDLYVNNCTLVLINQIRMKLGVMWGSPETTTGGNSTKFFASIRMDVRKIGNLEDENKQVYGSKIRIKTVKNKTAAAHRVVETDLDWQNGLDMLMDYVKFAQSFQIIEKELDDKGKEKKTSWFSFNGTRHNGAAQFANYLAEHADDFLLLKERVDAAIRGDMSTILSDESLGVTNAPEVNTDV